MAAAERIEHHPKEISPNPIANFKDMGLKLQIAILVRLPICSYELF